jgi:general secretion pathway protein E
MLSPQTVERFAVWWGVWLAWAFLWAAACQWIERDAGRIFGRALPFKTGGLVLGALFLLASYQYGIPTSAPLLLVLPLALVAYVGTRERIAPPESRLVSRFLRTHAGQPFSLGALWRSLRQRAADGGTTSDREVILMKKDGRMYDGQAAGDLDQETSKAIRSVQGIFLTAIDMDATDIHMEPKAGDEFTVRYRVDGIMQGIATLPGSAGRAVVSAMKVLADMDIAERRRPQDGTFAVLSGGSKYDVRAASGPTNFGEKVALRLLKSEGGMVKDGLKNIGMRDSMLATLRSIIHRPHGMLIVSGPTGSGKTTTVYGALAEIDVLSRNIITIEDPIEYRLDNISQTAVNPAADLTFAKILRSVLRQDPDVILVGEIRDRETAEIAMQAALTGHFVFTTLHANDTATTITRLLDIGIEATLIQSAVTAVVAQRLVRKLCERCKQPYEPPPDLLQRFGIPPNKGQVFYREKGCEHCHGTGYRGRTGVYELMVVDQAIRELLVGRPSIEAIKAAARKAGMRTLRQSGLYKVVAGVTSLEEIARVTK